MTIFIYNYKKDGFQAKVTGMKPVTPGFGKVPYTIYGPYEKSAKEALHSLEIKLVNLNQYDVLDIDFGVIREEQKG